MSSFFDSFLRDRLPKGKECAAQVGAFGKHLLLDADRDQGGADRQRRGRVDAAGVRAAARARDRRAITAARAAVIGGCAATSNCLAGMLYQIPVRGTHAHSWVMAFESELAAFSAYAEVMPNNCVFLVDTYETIAGVGHAVTVGQRLKARGHTMIGVRLDSGDLEALSFEARRLLDEGGLEEAVVVASNDLDERSIAALTAKGAPIGVYGVGTKLVTAYDQPALGGVYKLAAIRRPGEAWSYRLKRSEEAIKISNPGIQQVYRRFDADGRLFAEDIIYDEALGSAEALTDGEALLVPIFRGGARLYESPSVMAIQARAKAQLERLREGLRRLDPEDVYAVRLDARLAALKAALLEEAGG
jgi:nicotinate phosphoribosyltransferase